MAQGKPFSETLLRWMVAYNVPPDRWLTLAPEQRKQLLKQYNFRAFASGPQPTFTQRLETQFTDAINAAYGSPEERRDAVKAVWRKGRMAIKSYAKFTRPGARQILGQTPPTRPPSPQESLRATNPDLYAALYGKGVSGARTAQSKQRDQGKVVGVATVGKPQVISRTANLAAGGPSSRAEAAGLTTPEQAAQAPVEVPGGDDTVRTLQRDLNTRGANLVVDGLYGRLTLAADLRLNGRQTFPFGTGFTRQNALSPVPSAPAQPSGGATFLSSLDAYFKKHGTWPESESALGGGG